MIRQLLESKKAFWSDYLLGFSEIEHFNDKVQNLTQKIEKFRKLVEKQHDIDNDLSSGRAIYFKSLSACYSLFWNDINLAIKFEEDYQKIYANELIFNQNDKCKLSFINKDIAICEASFMSYEGVIRNAAQNKKMAQLFGFSPGELLLVKRIEALMPPFFGKIHKEFVSNFLNKSRTDHSKYPIFSFAQHKNGFIFPITLYFSIRSVKNDFVIAAAILYDEQNDEKLIIYNSSGEMIGVSNKMLLNFQKFFRKFDLNKFLTLNMFQCCHELENISHEHLMNNEFLLNKNADLEINMPEPGTRNSNRQTKKFEILFDLKILQYSLSHDKTIAVFNMTIKSMEVANINQSQRTMNSINELPINRDSIFLQEENVLDSPDAKNIASKTPRIFEVKEKESINSVLKNFGQNKITIGKEQLITEAKEVIMQKIALQKNATKCTFYYFYRNEIFIFLNSF